MKYSRILGYFWIEGRLKLEIPKMNGIKTKLNPILVIASYG
jgi:hypothetical protein